MVASRVPPTLLGTWPTIQACALTGNQTSDPLVYRLVLNTMSHTSQDLITINNYIHIVCNDLYVCFSSEVYLQFNTNFNNLIQLKNNNLETLEYERQYLNNPLSMLPGMIIFCILIKNISNKLKLLGWIF